MKNLLQTVITAAGGMEKWNSLKEVRAHLQVVGAIWEIKGSPEVFKDVYFYADIHNQIAGFENFPQEGQYTTFEPNLITIRESSGEIIDKSVNPRESFNGYTWDAKWNLLQLLYFSNYAFWTYLTLPFNFTLPGYEAEEIASYNDGSEILRRLKITTPDVIAAHNKSMIFYFGQNGLLKRIDYEPDIIGSIPSTQIVSDYREFNGIMSPTKRRIYMRNEDLTYNSEPVLVAVDVKSIDFR
jgi:hypothetical protein